MLAVITGAGGFAGTHLRGELTRKGHRVSALTHRDLDVTSSAAVEKMVQQTRPSAIFHFAAQSSASRSWTEPNLTYEVNVLGTHNLLDAVRRHCPTTRVLISGTSDVYGAAGKPDLLIKESDPIRPLSPYAASKLGQEAVARMFHEAYSLQTVVTRAFMHIGPGQPSSFATADWARQIALAENNFAEPILRVGDIDVVREFMDVRDVVAAYADLVSEAPSGSVLNIASGSGHSLREALEILLDRAQVPMDVQVDPTRIRAADPRALVGDPTKVREIIDWQPRYSPEQSLSEVLDYWRKQVSA